jgi:REP element-mobilizing transposase RayT
MQLLLEGIIARVQRDQKVTICHFLWMANHAHIVIVVKDSMQCTKFYSEIQKQITEAIKKLLGIKHLNLWLKNNASVVHYADLEGCVERIGYIYANPASADLVDTIDKYPGYSSWQVFKQASSTLQASFNKTCSWVRAPMIFKLPVRSVNDQQDKAIYERLKSAAKKSHTLSIEPNAWMGVFGIDSDTDVISLNEQIFARVQQLEERARENRRLKNTRTMGATKLTQEPLKLNYQTKSLSRKIFVYAFDVTIRTRAIKHYKWLCSVAQECYQSWKMGNYRVHWPPGMFLPAMPPRVNLLGV